MIRQVRVVAAVIQRGRTVLVTRRHDDAERGGLWEFPGGKVEPGENEPDALRREIREELACDVAVGPLVVRHRHRYPDLEVELAFYRCTLAGIDEPQALGVAELAWAEAGRLAMYDFCEADRPVLEDIERSLGSTFRSS
jgi:8-oxo-dGTP diphosphatase